MGCKDSETDGKRIPNAGFDGIAIGGLVPRARDTDLVHAIIGAVREEIPELPLHCFGLGKPETVSDLFAIGVDSVDSSSYVKLAANGKIWSNSTEESRQPSTTGRMRLALANLMHARVLPKHANWIPC